MRQNTGNDDGQLMGVIGLLYDAVLDTGRWPEAMGSVAGWLDSHGAAFAGIAPTTGRTQFFDGAGADQNHIDLWLQRYSTPETNPMVRGGLRHPLGTLLHSESLCSRAELERTDMYADLVAPLDFQKTLGMNIVVEPDLVCSMTIYRGLRSPDFGRFDEARFRQLVPHLERATQLRVRLSRLEARWRSTLDAMDRLPIGVLLLDRQCRAVFVNRLARQTLVKDDGLKLEHGHLVAAFSGEHRLLKHALGQAALTGAGLGLGSGRLRLLTRPSGCRPLTVLVSPAGSELNGAHRDAVALVLLSDPEWSPRDAAAELERLYGLTPAEASVALEVAQGRELATIAEERSVSLHTVRSQLYRVMTKTDTRRQAELLRLLLRGTLGLLAD
jgi:DNA-binding CsgD family transcriptional regulator